MRRGQKAGAAAAAVLAVAAVLASMTAVTAAVRGDAQAALPKDLAGLAGPFDLAGPLVPEERRYIQVTEFVQMGFDGKRKEATTYTLKLSVVPAALSGKGGDAYTVREVGVRTGGGEPETIPGLAGWAYVYQERDGEIDERGQIFGIPHAKFQSLTTSRGRKLGAIETYPIYNSFVDFHGFCDVIARPMAGGAGIQDLRTIGRSIRHAAAFSEPPVDLGEGIKKGSVFRNGDVRLTFKGIGLVDGVACAVVGYDSGESTLHMVVPAGPERDIVTDGGSTYLGDIYIDLGTRWVRKVTLDEFVITETRLPAAGAGAGAGPGQKIASYTVRHMTTRLVGREEFEK